MAFSSSITRAGLVPAFPSNKATHTAASLIALILIWASLLANSADAVLLPRRRKDGGSVRVLGNSPPDLNAYVAQQGGIYLGPDLALLLPNTTLSTSNESWVDNNRNIIVNAKIPYVSGTLWAKDIDPAGSVVSMTKDHQYRYFKGNGLPSTPMGKSHRTRDSCLPLLCSSSRWA